MQFLNNQLIPCLTAKVSKINTFLFKRRAQLAQGQIVFFRHGIDHAIEAYIINLNAKLARLLKLDLVAYHALKYLLFQAVHV